MLSSTLLANAFNSGSLRSRLKILEGCASIKTGVYRVEDVLAESMRHYAAVLQAARPGGLPVADCTERATLL